MSVRLLHSRGLFPLALISILGVASVVPTSAAEIDWTVRNRFPFLRYEEDFNKLEAAHLRDEGSGSKAFIGILAAQEVLSEGVKGANWAAPLTSTGKGRVCFDQNLKSGYGSLVERCDLHYVGGKTVTTTYVNPIRHLVEFGLTGATKLDGARCEWSFGSREMAPFAGPCGERFSRFVPRKIDRPDGSRVLAATRVTVRIIRPGAEDEVVESDVAVRDLLIVGMGDSIASGEGNPDRPIRLSEKGFCFRRYASGPLQEFYRPSRAKVSPYDVERACDQDSEPDGDRAAWDAGGADWLWRRCHRSMFGYQMRSAMALAIRNRHASVTYIPLGCSGAEIKGGILGEQDARERRLRAGYSDGGTVESQKSVLTNLLNLGSRRQRVRDVDAVLLSIGANDVGFSGLVADVLIAPGSRERGLLKSVIVDPDGARREIEGKLANDFRDLRAFLRSLVGDDLSRVIYTAYANPALKGVDATGRPVACGSGRQGVDVHPAFAVDGEKIATVTRFVDDTFIPALETLATCRRAEGSPIPANCADTEKDRMTFVAEHRAAFATHGFCATAASDPEFDRDCFRASGDSFDDHADDKPLRCARDPDTFSTYAKRQRWVRSPNDSYFAAMTYPFRRGNLASPIDLHDAFWGVLTAVYGGAIHPTAEGHAAMADAVLPKLESLLKLGR